MSYLIKLIIITILLSTISIKQSQASHYMGGEITWECIPIGQPNAGKFIFTMKVYRECGGITFGNSYILNSNSPAGSITMTLIAGWPKDISPICNIGGFGGTSVSEITCAGAEASGADNTGAVSEYIYHSVPVQISGVPPSGGWTFSWGSCCRNPSTNVNGSPGWMLRAKMYSYNNQNTYPCFDNSPVFAETALSILPAGYPTQYSNNTWDKELDKLTFEWGVPMATLITPISYTASFSHTSPLPDINLNPNNIAATINPDNGIISFTSYTTGAFLTSVKVSAYKSNVLVAEIWRGLQVVILTGGTNSPPIINPPFNGGTSFNDTVMLGDTISFFLNAQDVQFLPNGSPQTLQIQASGTQFGSYIPASGSNLATFSSTTGCINPPCATLTPAPDSSAPYTALIGIQTHFYWQTDTNHLRIDTNGYRQTTNYNFVIRATDDYCPVPASSIAPITITILAPPILTIYSPEIKSIIVNSNGDVSLFWDVIEDTNNVFDSYYIYCSDSINGNYTLIDSILNPNINTYTHYANLDIGKNKYYYLSINQSSNGGSSIQNSSIVTNIALKNNASDICIANLQWNAFSESSNEKYYILKKEGSTPWTLFDTTYLLNYTDTFNSISAIYRIELEPILITDSLGSNTIEITQSGTVSQSFNLDIGPDSTICEGESFIILPTGNSYDTYEWSTGFDLIYLQVLGSDFGIGTHYISLLASTTSGCQTSDTMILIVEDCTTLSEIEPHLIMAVFPNPSKGSFVVVLNRKNFHNAKLEIIDINGKLIYKHNSIMKNEIEIDLSDKPKGTYFIKLFVDKQIIKRKITII